MHRVTVALLAAFDAAIAAAAGIAATLAPLTLLWVFGLGDTADWGALWPASVRIWQFGNLVPLQITLPGEYLAETGIDPTAASFAVSLAPLAFASFTAIFAARSGARASSADAWITGVVTGSSVFAALGTLFALTSSTPVVEVQLWQAILFPALVFAVPALLGAVVTEWRDAGRGVVARLRDRTEALTGGWGRVPGLAVRSGAVAVAGLVGIGAVALAVALVAGAGEIVALYQAGNFDLLGAIVVTLAEFAYLPTLVVWAMSFVAGPGFALGAGTAVSPAGTQLGVLPGVPLLGAVPESTSTWLLLLVLLPIAVGALAGWIARSRFVGTRAPVVESATEPHEPFLPRLVLTTAIAVIAAGTASLLAAFASGAAGPGSLAEVGPQPGPVALSVGLEVALGAGILLLSSRRSREKPDAAPPVAGETPWGTGAETPAETPAGAPADPAPIFATPALWPAHLPRPMQVPSPAPAPAATSEPPPTEVPAPAPRPVTEPPASEPPAERPPAPAEPASVDPDADTAPIPLPPPTTDGAADPGRPSVD